MRLLCAVLQVHHSGYYAWRRSTHSQRHLEDQRLLALVQASWLESARVYGYRKDILDRQFDQALLSAVWRRKPKQRVMVHSDQGSQFTSYEWTTFLANHNLEPSMSRRGNCHDNAVV